MLAVSGSMRAGQIAIAIPALVGANAANPFQGGTAIQWLCSGLLHCSVVQGYDCEMDSRMVWLFTWPPLNLQIMKHNDIITSLSNLRYYDICHYISSKRIMPVCVNMYRAC